MEWRGSGGGGLGGIWHDARVDCCLKLEAPGEAELCVFWNTQLCHFTHREVSGVRSWAGGSSGGRGPVGGGVQWGAGSSGGRDPVGGGVQWGAGSRGGTGSGELPPPI